tara:strand:+ start:605 stop:1060 length:456 start_codon:yes stop_codon:yes gene_type:complete
MSHEHWLLRVGDGENFISSSKYGIWGIQSSFNSKHFLKNVKPGDILWFVQSKNQGKIIAVSTFSSHNLRDFGPLVDISLNNEQLGWNEKGKDWNNIDVEVHYTELYGLYNCELYTNITGPKTIRKYNEKCKINLENEYNHILRYSKVNFEL